jgi:thiol-disulfide isomerase/thioredoxin
MNANHLAVAAAFALAILPPLETSAQDQLEERDMFRTEPNWSVGGKAPSLDGATEWLNSPPLSAADLRGKVILIDFWTYSCINWIRSLPYVRAWASKYKDQGLVVIGVHTPEFEFEKNIDNVRRAAQEMGIDYPIAIDSEYAIWTAFRNNYWPALYFIDAQGQVRHHFFGEGDYARSETVIQELLTEAGSDRILTDPVSPNANGAEAAADWRNLRSPENYVGFQRTLNFASHERLLTDRPRVYSFPGRLRLNHWAASGNWTAGKQAIFLNKANGSVAYRFHARDLHLVMGPSTPGVTVRFRIRIDGQSPGTDRGTDVDENGHGTATEQRLYQLIRQSGPIQDRNFEIEFLDPGVEVFVFTFG